MVSRIHHILGRVPVTPGTHDLPKVTAEDLAAIAGITQKTLLDSLTTVIIPQAKGESRSLPFIINTCFHCQTHLHAWNEAPFRSTSLSLSLKVPCPLKQDCWSRLSAAHACMHLRTESRLPLRAESPR